ncbi:MAG TPA: N-acetylneuraminate synthase family protein [Patescibacteria group bacterium]|nr:N-acetylneuraminate synthase family protein [Patescibacteria group bacterium]
MTKIIAEICQNHLGQRDFLGQAIKAAAAAGSDYIKAQIIFSEDLTNRPRFNEGFVEDNGVVKTIKRPYQPEFERLKKLDLKEDDYKWFIEESWKNNIKPMATIFSRRRIEFAAGLPWPEKVVKVASYDCASHALIKELCDAFNHLIISTGATFDEEIEKTAEIVRSKGKKLTLLHCVTSYPNTLEMCHLARMIWLRRLNDLVGWSDHTLVKRDGLKAAKVAMLLGADFIERHFTILSEDQTKDGPISIHPQQLKQLVDFSRLARQEQKKMVDKEIDNWLTMIGDHKCELTHIEILNRDYYRGRFASYINGRWIYNWEE